MARRIWEDAKRARGYLASAARLLRRNPTLLVLPMAVVVFSAVEGAAGGQILAKHTAYGRALAEKVHSAAARKPGPGLLVVWTRYDFPGADVPQVTLSGTWRVVGAAVTGPSELGKEVSFRSVALIEVWGFLAACLVLGPLNALLRGGYYGVMASGVATGQARWREFGPRLRRLFARFWVLYALLALVVYGLFLATAFPWRASVIGGLHYSAFTWLRRVAAFVLALAALVIATDDCGVPAGIRRSLLTVVRDIVVTLVLAVGIGLAGWVVACGFGWLRGWARMLDPGYDLASIHWFRAAVDLGQGCLTALLSVLFVLAALTWYRDLSQRSRPAMAVQGAGGGNGTRTQTRTNPLPRHREDLSQPECAVHGDGPHGRHQRGRTVGSPVSGSLPLLGICAAVQALRLGGGCCVQAAPCEG